MAALKSDPSRPSVVVAPSGARPMNPWISKRLGLPVTPAHTAGASCRDACQSTLAPR